MKIAEWPWNSCCFEGEDCHTHILLYLFLIFQKFFLCVLCVPACTYSGRFAVGWTITIKPLNNFKNYLCQLPDTGFGILPNGRKYPAFVEDSLLSATQPTPWNLSFSTPLSIISNIHQLRQRLSIKIKW